MRLFLIAGGGGMWLFYAFPVVLGGIFNIGTVTAWGLLPVFWTREIAAVTAEFLS